MKKTFIFAFITIMVLLMTGCQKTKDTTTITTTDKEPVVEACNNADPAPNYKKKKCNDVLIVLPDTQMYTTTNQLAVISNAQMDWIVANQEKYGIKFTAHLGDLVNEPYSIPMWSRSDAAFQILDDAGIPYGVTAGNHDFQGTEGYNWYGWDDNSRSTREQYLKYFSQERTSLVEENYGGHSENGWNSYYYFEANDRTYMALFIDYVASDETIAWASSLMQDNNDIPVILFTHILTRPTSTPTSFIELEEAEQFWQKLIYENDQIFMSVNGHYAGSGYEIRQNKYDNDVILMVVDYQADVRGGNGWLRMLEFDEGNNQIHATSISPYVMSLSLEERTYDDVVQLLDPSNRYSLSLNYEQRFNFND